MKHKQIGQRRSGAVLMALVIGATGATAAAPDFDTAGVIDDIYAKESRLVVNDTAVWYGPELKVHGPGGTASIGVGALAPGKTVGYKLGFKGEQPYVSEIWVLNKLPGLEGDEDAETGHDD